MDVSSSESQRQMVEKLEKYSCMMSQVKLQDDPQKKHSRVFSQEQKEMLESLYHEHKYPTAAQKEDFAYTFGVETKRISTWFQCRRRKDFETGLLHPRTSPMCGNYSQKMKGVKQSNTNMNMSMIKGTPTDMREAMVYDFSVADCNDDDDDDDDEVDGEKELTSMQAAKTTSLQTQPEISSNSPSPSNPGENWSTLPSFEHSYLHPMMKAHDYSTSGTDIQKQGASSVSCTSDSQYNGSDPRVHYAALLEKMKTAVAENWTSGMPTLSNPYTSTYPYNYSYVSKNFPFHSSQQKCNSYFKTDFQNMPLYDVYFPKQKSSLSATDYYHPTQKSPDVGHTQAGPLNIYNQAPSQVELEAREGTPDELPEQTEPYNLQTTRSATQQETHSYNSSLGPSNSSLAAELLWSYAAGGNSRLFNSTNSPYDMTRP